MINEDHPGFKDLAMLVDGLLLLLYNNGGMHRDDLLWNEFDKLEREMITGLGIDFPDEAPNSKLEFTDIKKFLIEENLISIYKNGIVVQLTYKGKMKLLRGGFKKEYHDYLKLIELSEKSFNVLNDQLVRADDQIKVLKSQLDNSTSQLNALTQMSTKADASSKQAIKYSILALVVAGLMGVLSIIVGIWGIKVSATEAKQAEHISLIDSVIQEQKRNRELIDTIHRLNHQKEKSKSNK